MKKEIIVKWRIKETETAEILQLLPELAKKTRQEEGNLLYTVYQSESNPNELFLHEQYTDEAAMEAHKNSEHYQTIVAGKIIPYLENRELAIVNELL